MFSCNFRRIDNVFLLKFIYKNKLYFETLHTKLWLHFDVRARIHSCEKCSWKRMRGRWVPCRGCPLHPRLSRLSAERKKPWTNLLARFESFLVLTAKLLILRPVMKLLEPQYIQEREWQSVICPRRYYGKHSSSEEMSPIEGCSLFRSFYRRYKVPCSLLSQSNNNLKWVWQY